MIRIRTLKSSELAEDLYPKKLYTLQCDASDGTVFAEMSSWAALTCYTVMETAFKTKTIKRKSVGIFIMKIVFIFYILRVIEEYAYLKKFST